MTQVLRRGEFEAVEWDEVRPGEFVKIRNGEVVPADMLLLTSSSETGFCYVETANLDGESNLKEKRTLAEVAHLTPA
jgi:phospholipid-transporting ATPase